MLSQRPLGVVLTLTIVVAAGTLLPVELNPSPPSAVAAQAALGQRIFLPFTLCVCPPVGEGYVRRAQASFCAGTHYLEPDPGLRSAYLIGRGVRLDLYEGKYVKVRGDVRPPLENCPKVIDVYWIAEVPPPPR